MKVRFNCLGSIILSIVLTILLNLLFRSCNTFSAGGATTF